MPEPHDHRGQPWDGAPPWARGRSGWSGGPGRRFRRGAFLFLVVVVLLVAALATLVASVVSDRAPAPGMIAVAAVVIVGLTMSARWLWRNARAAGALIDASDRVADGDYTARVGPAPGQLGRVTTAFDEMAARLETNERRRRELLGDIAHELRTPLQVIRGSVEGMLDGLYPTDPDRLHGLLDETVMMARLLDDLRTLSMADEGVLVLHREPVDVRVLAREAVRAFDATATAAGVRLTVAADGPSPTIEADPVRLAEVLGNLLANAIRHTPREGEVTIGVATDGTTVVLDVDDTGEGIAPERLATVFDRFERSADTGGSGLGLAIAKRLVDAHGGTIAAAARPAGGTRFRVRLPG